MAEEGDIDIEGDFDFKLQANSDVYDTNELPSKTANLLPEYTNPAWMLEQGWSMDSYIDEKSKATIEKMLQEEQYYMNGQKGRRNIRHLPGTHKQPWSEEEKNLFVKGLEIYGRSWSKIAELIQTRTNLQVKNYAQQYFKQQVKPNKSEDSIVNEEISSARKEKSHPATLEQMLRAVTTASPTVSVPTVTKAHNHTTISSSDQNRKSFVDFESMLAKELTKDDKGKKENKNNGSLKRSPVDVNKNKRIKLDNSLLTPQVRETKHMVTNKPPPLVKIKTVKGSTSKNKKDVIGLNDVLEVVTIPSVQLSPTLEHKLQKSTGLIENLDRFCAVADIVSGNCSEEEDIDIDIENDDDNEDNVILKNRSTSPNSVYESLLKSAKVKMKPKVQTEIREEITDNPIIEEVVEEVVYEDTGLEDKPNMCSESSEDTLDSMTEGEGSNSGNSHTEDKVIVNMVVLSSGEVVEFPIPTEARELSPDIITEEERRVHIEFFDGRPSKTPDRYLKIRNYIIDSWKKSSPNYLNKTSVRPGLKNCGDVNCIGRIHAYLECIGAINFGCDQCSYNNPVKLSSIGFKEKTRDVIGKGGIMKYFSSQRSRKRKVKDAYGNWINEEELHGKTIEHQDKSEESGSEKSKSNKGIKSFYDPFKLIPCCSFTEDIKAPFTVEISSSCLVIMDVHAHVAKTEIIGMLGGQFSEGHLSVTMAIPCNSISTGMQCEMDPVSQTQASEEIQRVGMSVVGWYHSHPTFEPNPSIMDIETQLKFQEWFSKGGSSYIGVIISPYSRLNPSLTSEIQCLTISDERDPVMLCNKPYRFDMDVSHENVNCEELLSVIQQIAEKYSTYKNRVDMLGSYRSFTGHTCLSKMLVSISELTMNNLISEAMLGTIENIFTELFSQQIDTSNVLQESTEELTNVQTDELSVKDHSGLDIHVNEVKNQDNDDKEEIGNEESKC